MLQVAQTTESIRDRALICDERHQQLKRSLPNASREVADTLRVIDSVAQPSPGGDVMLASCARRMDRCSAHPLTWPDLYQ